MTLQYGQVLHYLPDFLLGAGMALWIAALAFVGGLLIGLVGAAVLTQGPLWMRMPVIGYVRFFTYTPQLVQIFFLFFALPEFGIILSPITAVLIGMTLNAGAYLTEIERAGFASVPQAELDAAEQPDARGPGAMVAEELDQTAGATTAIAAARRYCFVHSASCGWRRVFVI